MEELRTELFTEDPKRPGDELYKAIVDIVKEAVSLAGGTLTEDEVADIAADAVDDRLCALEYKLEYETVAPDDVEDIVENAFRDRDVDELEGRIDELQQMIEELTDRLDNARIEI